MLRNDGPALNKTE